MSSLLFQIPPRDVVSFAFGAFVLLSAALIESYLQRAAPRESIRWTRYDMNDAPGLIAIAILVSARSCT